MRSRMRSFVDGAHQVAWTLVGACATVSCATVPVGGGGDEALPNAAAGPFREIDQAELGNSRAAPNVMDDGGELHRDATVVDLDGDPGTLAAAGYFAATIPAEGMDPDWAAPPNAIVRQDAADGRSFDRSSVVVLAPELGWEGGTVGAPSALRVGGEIWLYYAGAGGIGLARSGDGGTTFVREAEPVLGAAAQGWDAAAVPGSPGVVAMGDGSMRMFYEVKGVAGLAGEGAAIGEARSSDGVTWERVGAGPAIAARGGERAGAEAGEAGEEPYDSAAVGDPAAVVTASATGRTILRVYYAARDSTGRGTIAMAARFGEEGALERAVAPVFGAASSLGPRAPWVMVYPGFSVLFATQKAGTTDARAYPAVAGGVAPADVQLPPPEPL